MTLNNVGASVILEPNSLYVRLHYGPEEPDGVPIIFNVMHTMDKEDEKSQYLNCAVRGLWEIFMRDPEFVVATGANAFAEAALRLAPDPVMASGGGDNDDDEKPSNVINLATMRPMGNAQ